MTRTHTPAHPHRTTRLLPGPGEDNFTSNLYEAICAAPTLSPRPGSSSSGGGGGGGGVGGPSGSGSGWAPDPSLFSTILLALIGRQGGVIVDTPEGETRSAVHAVAAILESVFGLYLQFIHVDANTEPSSLTRLLLQDPKDASFRTPRPSPAVSTYTSARQSPSTPFSILPSFSPTHPTHLSHSPAHIHPHLSPTSPAPRTAHPYPPISTNHVVTRLRSVSTTNALIITGHLGASKVAIELVEALTRGYATTPGAGDEQGAGERARRDLRDTLVVWVRDEVEIETPFWLIDTFSCSTFVSDLEPTPDLERNALIPASYIHDLYLLLSFTHIHPPLQIQLTNLVSALLLDPRLTSTLTARATAVLNTFTRAHRLLSAPFDLPAGWREGLAVWEKSGDVPPPGPGARLGLGGGRGGVATWARRAGEEPDVTKLAKIRRETGEEGGGWGEDGEEDQGEDWYALPSNVRGIWSLCVRHRTSWRRRGEASLWAMEGSARERLKESSKRLAKGGKGGKGEKGKKEEKAREQRFKEREMVDEALEEILVTV